MKVSFGSIICRKDCVTVSPKQRWLAEMTKNAFDVDENKEYAYGADARGREITLHQYLQNKKGVDVVITAQKNKSAVEVSLKKTLRDKSGEALATWTEKLSGHPMKIVLDTEKFSYPTNEVKIKLAAFARKCLTYARMNDKSIN